MRQYRLILFTCALLITSVLSCIRYCASKNDLLVYAEYKNTVCELCQKLSNIDGLKSTRAICSRRQLKKYLTEIIKEHAMLNVHLKRDGDNSFELVCDTADEQQIYRLINAMYFRLPGIVHFKNVKIRLTDDQRLLHIQLKVQIDKHVANYDRLRIYSRSDRLEQFNIFPHINQYRLLCVLDGKKVFINNRWYNLYDTIGDATITEIGVSSITLQDHEVERTIQLGESW